MLPGYTGSTDFPTANAVQPLFAGGGVIGGDIFVTKLNSTGSALVYSTYLGGSGNDYGNGIAVDAAGSACLTGSTNSADFPTANALQPTFGGGSSDSFVAKLDPSGLTLAYSTYLGGSDEENSSDFFGYGRIALDSLGNAYVTGRTASTDFPTVNPLQPANTGGSLDVFVTKLNVAGTAMVYSTFLGGDGLDGSGDIAVDTSGSVYVTGFTSSTNFPTMNAFQQFLSGGSGFFNVDAFVAKIGEDSNTLIVPLVPSSANNSLFASELTLTNRGIKNASLDLTYTAVAGGGSGTGSDILLAGQQRIIPDAITYLKSIGIPIPESGNRSGTLAVRFSGLSSTYDAAVTVRTTTRVAGGRVGFAYAGIPSATALTGTSYLCGLRQDMRDRSDVCIQNVASSTDSDITLRLTILSGDPAVPFSQVLPDITLAPGGLTHLSDALQSNGSSLTNGYVRVERVNGTAPYYAYAVIYDRASSDGSFVPAMSEKAQVGSRKLTIPVIVEAGSLTSELFLTNFASIPKMLSFAYVADAIQANDSTAKFVITLNPHQQVIIPNVVQYLRSNGIAGLGAVGPVYTGALFAEIGDGDASGISLAARTVSQAAGGQFGVFYSAVPFGIPGSTWLHGLQQNAETRTNLALANTGEIDGASDVFRIELFDGLTGTKVNTIEGIALDARRWLQVNSLLAQYAPGIGQGYARIIRTGGSNPFITYAIINDGGRPGEGTGDGAFVSSSP